MGNLKTISIEELVGKIKGSFYTNNGNSSKKSDTPNGIVKTPMWESESEKVEKEKHDS